LDEACPPPPVSHVIEPEPELVEALAPRRALYRQLYSDLKSSFAASVS
jgi:xylulokinase